MVEFAGDEPELFMGMWMDIEVRNEIMNDEMDGVRLKDSDIGDKNKEARYSNKRFQLHDQKMSGANLDLMKKFPAQMSNPPKRGRRKR